MNEGRRLLERSISGGLVKRVLGVKREVEMQMKIVRTGTDYLLKEEIRKKGEQRAIREIEEDIKFSQSFLKNGKSLRKREKLGVEKSLRDREVKKEKMYGRADKVRARRREKPKQTWYR